MTKTQDKAFQILWNEARMAGLQAVMEITPKITPMVVVQHANPMDEKSPVVRQYVPVMDGPCGFGWIEIHPANCAFANWCRKKGFGRTSSYRGGLHINVHEFNQSLLKKEAYAYGFAAVLSEAGINAYGQSRID